MAIMAMTTSNSVRVKAGLLGSGHVIVKSGLESRG
jgi:hypothetical protein